VVWYKVKKNKIYVIGSVAKL